MSILISAVICTYNRANLLSGALESLCQQTLAPDRYEIIVVDNASTDNTAEVVQVFQEKYSTHNIRRVYEARQGLGYARNAILQDAVGAYIAYLDDDARAEINWLELPTKRFSGFTTLHCLGGPIRPFYTAEKPSWFKDQYETRTWGDEERRLEPGESLSGSNMIWHKETLQSIGGFGVTMGVKGKTLSVGEDTIAFRHLWQVEPDAVIIYDPTLVIYHWVPPFKMRVSYYLKRAFVIGQVAIRLENPSSLFWRYSTGLRSGGAVIVRAVRALWRFPGFRHWQNWAIEECLTIASRFGTCCAAFGIVFEIRQK